VAAPVLLGACCLIAVSALAISWVRAPLLLLLPACVDEHTAVVCWAVVDATRMGAVLCCASFVLCYAVLLPSLELYLDCIETAVAAPVLLASVLLLSTALDSSWVPASELGWVWCLEDGCSTP
jgi:hypothetical protein